MYKLILIPVISQEMLNIVFDLPLPYEGNTGGYKIKAFDDTVHSAYSPIDLAVACLTRLYEVAISGLNQPPITDLSKWFINNQIRIGEMWVNCTVAIYNKGILDNILTHSIVNWKLMCHKNASLLNIFKTNAPFTFRENH